MADQLDEVLAAESDPLERYEALTQAQQWLSGATIRIANERAKVIAELHDELGMSYQQIGVAVGMTRARAQQLAAAGKEPEL